MGAKEPSNTRGSAGGEGGTPTPTLESTLATANLRRQIPLPVVRTRQPDPSATAAATAATPPPRRALGTRTASEADDADEAAPPVKRDCTTSTTNSRQQTCLATFRVRPLQTPVTSAVAPTRQAAPLRARPGALEKRSPQHSPPHYWHPAPPLRSERARLLWWPHALQQTSPPHSPLPAGQLQQPQHQPPSRKRPRASLEYPDGKLFPSEPAP